MSAGGPASSASRSLCPTLGPHSCTVQLSAGSQLGRPRAWARRVQTVNLELCHRPGDGQPLRPHFTSPAAAQTAADEEGETPATARRAFSFAGSVRSCGTTPPLQAAHCGSARPDHSVRRGCLQHGGGSKHRLRHGGDPADPAILCYCSTRGSHAGSEPCRHTG